MRPEIFIEKKLKNMFGFSAWEHLSLHPENEQRFVGSVA